jgi:hypothetical protein
VAEYFVDIALEYPLDLCRNSAAHDEERVDNKKRVPREPRDIVASDEALSLKLFVFQPVLDTEHTHRRRAIIGQLEDAAQQDGGGIVEASFKADGAERSETVCNADAEANLVSQATPSFRQRSDSLTHFERHQHSFRGSQPALDSLKTTITPSPAYRSSVPLYFMIIAADLAGR